MKALGSRVVAALVSAFPSPFRERFGAEMLATYLDQRDSIAAGGNPHLDLWRHDARTVVSLFRALHAERRATSIRIHAINSRSTHRADPMSDFLFDLRLTFRSLRTRPGFAALAILTLALGIGANTAVFSVLNSVILSPLPYAEPGQLVRLYSAELRTLADKNYHSAPDIVDIRDQVSAFASVAIMGNYREQGADITTSDGHPERVRVLPVGADYFRTFGATPLLGATFTRDDERPGVRKVVISHALWQSFAAGNRNVIGRTVTFNGDSYEVVGVMRPTFSDLNGSDVAAWIPLNLAPGENSRGNHYLSAVARLRDGVTMAQARTQLEPLMRRIDEQFSEQGYYRAVNVVALHDDVVGSSSSAVYILMGAAGLVLLIACLNVANLFLARSVAQTRETAIRSALGAGRSRLIGARLSESLLIALIGGLVGSVTAYGGVKALLALSPESLARAEQLHFDPVLLGFALGITVLTGVLFGAAPAVRASRADPQDALHDASRGNTSGRGSRHVRSLLVASQVSVALVLLVGAGLLIQAFAAQLRRDPGFDPSNVMTFEVNLPNARYDSASRRVLLHEALQAKLRALPGVTNVGATSWLPTNGMYHSWGFSYLDAQGARQRTQGQVRVVDGDYLATLGIPLIAGRTFGSGDQLAAPGAALISQSLSRAAFAERDPLGQQFRTGGRDFTVVGVIADVASDASWATAPLVLLSHDQFADDRNWVLTYVVKSTLADDQVVQRARATLAEVDPALVLFRPQAMEAVMARHLARDRFVLVLMLIFGAVALSLAAVGVYGVLSYLVTQRHHEIGVRMALGAQPGQVRAIVMRQGLVVAGVGVVIGVAGAAALGGVLQSLAQGVQARDPLVFAGATLVLGVAVVLAGYLPTRRATRVSPLEALRND
ncbi:MAG: ABC transporter permease [Cytophagaceae bacterium]|nr:ABC transporter permease [Gemmatimonadaceae bacterium]